MDKIWNLNSDRDNQQSCVESEVKAFIGDYIQAAKKLVPLHFYLP
jgi:hypothetical protein